VDQCQLVSNHIAVDWSPFSAKLALNSFLSFYQASKHFAHPPQFLLFSVAEEVLLS
jgi:hypothetical protein